MIKSICCSLIGVILLSTGAANSAGKSSTALKSLDFTGCDPAYSVPTSYTYLAGANGPVATAAELLKLAGVDGLKVSNAVHPKLDLAITGRGRGSIYVIPGVCGLSLQDAAINNEGFLVGIVVVTGGALPAGGRHAYVWVDNYNNAGWRLFLVSADGTSKQQIAHTVSSDPAKWSPACTSAYLRGCWGRARDSQSPPEFDTILIAIGQGKYLATNVRF